MGSVFTRGGAPGRNRHRLRAVRPLASSGRFLEVMTRTHALHDKVSIVAALSMLPNR
jgi:hypothetical protein